MKLASEALYLLPLAILGGLTVGGAWGVLGATITVAVFVLNMAAFGWLVPRLIAGGDWFIWVAMGYSAKSMAILAACSALALTFGPYPVAIGLVCGLGGVCIRRLLFPDADAESGYVGPPEGTGSDEAPG